MNSQEARRVLASFTHLLNVLRVDPQKVAPSLFTIFKGRDLNSNERLKRHLLRHNALFSKGILVFNVWWNQKTRLCCLFAFPCVASFLLSGIRLWVLNTCISWTLKLVFNEVERIGFSLPVPLPGLLAVFIRCESMRTIGKLLRIFIFFFWLYHLVLLTLVLFDHHFVPIDLFFVSLKFVKIKLKFVSHNVFVIFPLYLRCKTVPCAFDPRALGIWYFWLLVFFVFAD